MNPHLSCAEANYTCHSGLFVSPGKQTKPDAGVFVAPILALHAYNNYVAFIRQPFNKAAP